MEDPISLTNQYVSLRNYLLKYFSYCYKTHLTKVPALSQFYNFLRKKNYGFQKCRINLHRAYQIFIIKNNSH